MGTLHELLVAEHALLIERWRRRVTGPITPGSSPVSETLNSLPVFLEELTRLLEQGAMADDGGEQVGQHALASEHGHQRFHAGFSLESVIREYGVLKDCIWELAEERGIPLPVAQIRLITRVFTNAIIDASTRYARERDRAIQDQAVEHLSFLAHELRTPLTSQGLALQQLRRRGLLPKNSLVELIFRGQEALHTRLDAALTESRLKARRPAEFERETVSIKKMLDDALADMAPHAEEKRVALEVDVSADLEVRADWRLLRSALTNLVQNALKFTRQSSVVTIRGTAAEGVVALEVEDCCGGLREGQAERLFTPHAQLSDNRKGFGLGLSIAKQAIESQGGMLSVRNLPDKGCVFRIELPVLHTTV